MADQGDVAVHGHGAMTIITRRRRTDYNRGSNHTPDAPAHPPQRGRWRPRSSPADIVVLDALPEPDARLGARRPALLVSLVPSLHGRGNGRSSSSSPSRLAALGLVAGSRRPPAAGPAVVHVAGRSSPCLAAGAPVAEPLQLPAFHADRVRPGAGGILRRRWRRRPRADGRRGSTPFLFPRRGAGPRRPARRAGRPHRPSSFPSPCGRPRSRPRSRCRWPPNASSRRAASSSIGIDGLGPALVEDGSRARDSFRSWRVC